jgi:energy-coupling factor transporter transmembrane protein EcfT
VHAVELLPVVALAVVGALLTLLLCDLAGDIARAKGRSYWLFFAFGLLLWFPALIVALRLYDRTGVEPAPEPGAAESAVAAVLVALAAFAAVAGFGAALAYAP